MRCETSRDVALDEAVDDHADLRPFLTNLGRVPLFGGVGLVVGVALAIFVFVKIRPYLK